MSGPPAVPSLNLEEAKKKNNAVAKKDSFSKKLYGSIKKLSTPRGSKTDSKFKENVDNIVDTAAKDVSEAKEKVENIAVEAKQDVENVVEKTEKAAADAPSRLSNTVTKATAPITSNDKEKRDDTVKKVVGVAITVAAVLVAVAAGKPKKKKEPVAEPAAPKKKLW